MTTLAITLAMIAPTSYPSAVSSACERSLCSMPAPADALISRPSDRRFRVAGAIHFRPDKRRRANWISG